MNEDRLVMLQRLERIGATQRELALAVETTEASLSRWLHGRRPMSPMVHRSLLQGIRRLERNRRRRETRRAETDL